MMKKRSNSQYLRWSGLLGLTTLFLSGCVKMENGVPADSGIVNTFFYKPMLSAIQFFAENQGLGFGLAIVIVTIIVRSIILPLGLYQAWKASYHSEKMAYLKPVFEPLQEKLKQASNQQEQLMAQQALFALQKEYGVSPLGGMGCLPVLAQFPFFSGIYAATRFTPGISDATFAGIPLGKPSLVFTVLTGVLYLFQSWYMVKGMDQNTQVTEAQQATMKNTMYMTPIMMVIMSLTMPAGVQLYWVVGGLFGLIQQLITQRVIKPHLRQKIEEEFKHNPPKASPIVKDVTPTSDAVISAPKKTNRNAGKQRSR